MKLHLILTFFAFITIQNLSAQQLSGVIIDENNETLIAVNVKDTIYKTHVLTNTNGAFYIGTKSNSVIEISFMGYETVYLKKFNNDDTIKLKTNARQLGTFTITSNRIKNVIKRKSVNVLDYIPYKEFTLALTVFKNKKYIALEGIDTTYYKFKIDRINGKSFHEDCMGNVHLLSKDSAYQLFLDNELYIIDAISLTKFNKEIKPCVAKFDENFVYHEFTNHNKRYSLSYFDTKKFTEENFFISWDKEGEKVAKVEYDDILAYYHKVTPQISNVIKNKVWNGNLLALANDPELVKMISWYLKIKGKEIDVKSFQNRNYLTTFDLLNNDIVVFNNNGKQIHETTFKTDKKNFKDIMIDKYNFNYYQLNLNKGIYSLYRVDINKGELVQNFTLTEFPFAENIKVFDNWLYFTAAENGYQKLYRVSIN